MSLLNPARFVVPLCVGLLVIGSADRALAATQVLAPSDDTFINSASPDNDNGASSSVFTGTDGHGGAMRGLIRFAMPPGLQGHVTVTGAQLRLVVRALPNGTTAPATVETLAAVSQSWLEGNGVGETSGTYTVGQACGGSITGATWNDTMCTTATAWLSAGGTVAASPSAQASTSGVAAGSPVLWDSAANPGMTSDVQSWIDAPTTNDGWRMASSTEGVAGSAQRFYSKESGTSAPSLTITYTCKPGFVESGTSCVAVSVPAVRGGNLLLLGVALAAVAGVVLRGRRCRPSLP
jgi:hypothetical protein